MQNPNANAATLQIARIHPDTPAEKLEEGKFYRTGRACGTCKGEIAITVSRQFDGSRVTPNVGLGVRNQWIYRKNIYCSCCGNMYYFAPPTQYSDHAYAIAQAGGKRTV